LASGLQWAYKGKVAERRLTVREVAELAGIRPCTARGYVLAGVLPVAGKDYSAEGSPPLLVREEDAAAWIASRRAGAEARSARMREEATARNRALAAQKAKTASQETERAAEGGVSPPPALSRRDLVGLIIEPGLYNRRK
jgi:hypothetical protein